jgi:hypothetical protein
MFENPFSPDGCENGRACASLYSARNNVINSVVSPKSYFSVTKIQLFVKANSVVMLYIADNLHGCRDVWLAQKKKF